MKNITFIIPCYNEAPDILESAVGSIKSTLDQVKDLQYEIIVVDDGSDKYSYDSFSNDERVNFIRHLHNKGYSSSLLTGIDAAKYDIIGICDADGTYPLDFFPAMVDIIGDYDMIVGKRSWTDIPKIRVPAKFILQKFAGMLAGCPIPDLNSGMRLFKKDVALKFRKMFPQRFSFTSTLTMGFLCNGYDVKFLDIPYHKREGSSHIHPVKDTIGFFSLVIRLVLYFRPLRFFMPVSFVFLAAAIARGIRDVVFTADHAFGGLTLVFFFLSFQVFFFGLLAEIINKK